MSYEVWGRIGAWPRDLLLPPYPWILSQSRLVIHGLFHPLPMPNPIPGGVPNGKTWRLFDGKPDVKRYQRCWEAGWMGGPRWRKKQGKGLKLHWLKYLDVKLSPLKLSERAQKTHLTGLINRWVRCWNYFKTDAFLNCIQNTFQGS